MNTSRRLQSAAFALALTITLGVFGGLNALANDPHAAQAMAQTINTRQAHAWAAATSPAAVLQVAGLGG